MCLVALCSLSRLTKIGTVELVSSMVLIMQPFIRASIVRFCAAVSTVFIVQHCRFFLVALISLVLIHHVFYSASLFSCHFVCYYFFLQWFFTLELPLFLNMIFSVTIVVDGAWSFIVVQICVCIYFYF